MPIDYRNPLQAQTLEELLEALIEFRAAIQLNQGIRQSLTAEGIAQMRAAGEEQQQLKELAKRLIQERDQKSTPD